MGRRFFDLLVSLSLCLSVAFFFSHCTKKGKESAPTPDFTLKTLDGKEITLSGLKGKVILLDFWATWCGPCREAIPHLVQLYKAYQDKGFEVIGMSMDKGEGLIVRHFVKSMDIPYPIILAPDDVAKSYGVTALPTTFFIGKDGKVREKIVGFNSTIAKEMAARVADLIAEKP